MIMPESVRSASFKVLDVWIEEAERVDLRQELRAERIVGGAERMNMLF